MKKKNWLIAGLALSLAFVVFSCNKDSRQNEITVDNSVAAMAKKFTEPIDAQTPALIRQYATLNIEQLKHFWVDIMRISNAQLSSAEEKNIRERIGKFNQESIAKYGKPYNALQATEIREIISPAETAPSSPSFIPPVNDDPPPCTINSYPLQFWPASTGTPSPPANSVTSVAYYFPNDCEGFEFNYAGNTWSSMLAITPLGQMVMTNGYGDPWPWRARRAGGYTRVFAPVSFVNGWFGNSTNFSNHVRVSGMALEY